MKIGFFKRVVFVLAGILVLITSLIITLITWQFWPFQKSVQYNDIVAKITDTAQGLYYADDTTLAIVTAAVIIFIAIGIVLLVFGFKKNKGEKAKAIEYIEIATSENGKIKIAKSTINSMICKNVNEIAGVTNSMAKTNVVDDKTFITVGVSVGDGVIIPKVCEEIQTSTKEKIQQLTGMTIADINILVNNKM